MLVTCRLSGDCCPNAEGDRKLRWHDFRDRKLVDCFGHCGNFQTIWGAIGLLQQIWRHQECGVESGRFFRRNPGSRNSFGGDLFGDVGGANWFTRGIFAWGSLVKNYHLEDLEKLVVCTKVVKHHFLRGGRIHGKIARFFQAGPATGATAESSEWWKIPKPSEDGRGWLKSQIRADFSEGWVPPHPMNLSFSRRTGRWAIFLPVLIVMLMALMALVSWKKRCCRVLKTLFVPLGLEILGLKQV